MKQPKQTTPTNPEGGFTLIELMVSLSLFVIVVLAAIASLYTVNNASKKVQAMRTSLDNLNFAIESMSRTIRTGANLGCNNVKHQDCSLSVGSNQGIVVTSTLGFKGDVQFILNNSSVVKIYPGGIQVPLTSPEINIQNLAFYVDGSCNAAGNFNDGTSGCNADYRQPTVMILMQGTAVAGGSIAPFAVQTLITQRTFE